MSVSILISGIWLQSLKVCDLYYYLLLPRAALRPTALKEYGM